MGSCFVLVGTHQHCVVNICNASQRANVHINWPAFTISGSLLIEPLCYRNKGCNSTVSALQFIVYNSEPAIRSLDNGRADTLFLQVPLIWYAVFLKRNSDFQMFRPALPSDISSVLLFETPNMTLCLLAPRNTCCGNACFGKQVGSKLGTWYNEEFFFSFKLLRSLHVFLARSKVKMFDLFPF